MSELFMECEEEELEPWQKQVPEVNLVDDNDDDDEPIFVGELTNIQGNKKPNPTPVQRSNAGRQGLQSLAPQPTRGSAQIMLSSNIPGKAVNSATPSLTTIAPQPVIVNNQGFIVTPPQMSNTELIASLGKQYPPGTSFTIVPAGQQHLLQQVTPAKLIPGVVHRPQVQQINNNVVTLSNVQSPATYSTSPNQLQVNRSNSQTIQIFSVPVNTKGNNRGQDQSSVKRALLPQQHESSVKKAKLDLEPAKVIDLVENGILKKKCPKCNAEFLQQEAMKCHMMSCCGNLPETVLPSTPSAASLIASKRIMFVSDFYYGRFEGDGQKQQGLKTNTTFKCQSCLKVLKNNIRFMNHMKHHLELEKQNSESWESHTTCQHCYRQYSTPFQLQCHIESAHSPFESSTNCKICELAFESEQVLLEHMKDNHKPGEMPYVCQVCNFRSSFFSDVETHFRNVHEHTKDLLCPFCLKVLRSSHTYMQHYMKHQKKGIQRCGKCRLNFLTFKEKVDHKTHFHKTFRKPKALEGLPPGTKVTIRASLTGKIPVSPNTSDRTSYVSLETPTPKQQAKAQSNTAKSKSNSSAGGRAKPAQTEKKRASKHNLVLRNIRIDGGRYTCIECDTVIDDFFSHYPMTTNCGACKYRTSCKVSIGNHMIRFHSAITKDRFRRMANRKKSPALKCNLLCLNCDLFVDAMEGDLMTKHLLEKQHHECKVIQEKDAVDVQAEDQGLPALGEPSKVLDRFPSTPVEQPKEMDMKQDVESGGGLLVDNETVLQPEEVSEQTFSAADRAKVPTEATPVERSPEGESQRSLLPSSVTSSVCTLDGGVGPLDESLGNSVSLGVTEQVSAPPEPLISSVLEHETGSTQTEVNSLSNQNEHESPLNTARDKPEHSPSYETASMRQRRNMSRSQQERMVSVKLRQEEQRREQNTRIDKERQIQAQVMSEERFENKRYLRKVQEELHERQIEDALQKAEEERINKEKQLEQEERIAKELARINYEKQRDEKMRQYIRENSTELRELELKLKSAYTNRERAAQIAEKEAMRFETMRQEADFARKMKVEHERASIEEKKLEQKHYEELMQHQKALEQQLMDKERKSQEAYEEFLKDKLMVDEIVRKIYEEDQMERQLKVEKMRTTQQYIEEFKRQQAEWRRMEQAKMEAENRRIMEFASYQQQMEESRIAKVQEREQAKQHLHKMLTEKMEMEKQQREEMERVREELLLEEQAEATRQKEIEEMEKKIRQRLALQQICQEQMAFKEMQKQAEKEEEEAFCQMMMAKFAEDDRIEQMNAQKRRMKQLEHKRAVEKLIEDRRQQHKMDKELEAKERAIEQEREALRRQIIDEERQRLLKRHATKLLGYIPKGLFREDDLEHFDEEFRSNFLKRQVDIFSEEGWESDE
ncbi:uncharacterized protein ACJ7VT_000159 [Polymixia lowei]